MRALLEWLDRLRATLHPGRRDEELAEELRLHREMVAEEARRRGDDREDAVGRARLRAGGSAQAMEALRHQRGLPWLEDLARDAAYGLRTLRRKPGFAATAMLSLALGIGANTGIFSLVDQLLLRTLPVREPDRLVLLDWRGPTLPSVQYGDESLLSYPLCQDLAAQRQYFEGVVCSSAGSVNLSTDGGYELARSEVVSGSYFEVLGVRAASGRLIGPADDLQPGAHPVVVISHDYWQTNLGAAPDVVGRSVLVNKHPMTIIGVAAEGFPGLDVGDLDSGDDGARGDDRLRPRPRPARVLDARLCATAIRRQRGRGGTRPPAVVHVDARGRDTERRISTRDPAAASRLSRVV